MKLAILMIRREIQEDRYVRLGDKITAILDALDQVNTGFDPVNRVVDPAEPTSTVIDPDKPF